MRVNVTYSIELEEVNELVENILKQIEKDFENLSDDFPKIMFSVVEDQNEKKAVAFIKEFRDKLATVDVKLNDCASILSGYQNTLLQISAAESTLNNVGGGDAPTSG